MHEVSEALPGQKDVLAEDNLPAVVQGVCDGCEWREESRPPSIRGAPGFRWARREMEGIR